MPFVYGVRVAQGKVQQYAFYLGSKGCSVQQYASCLGSKGCSGQVETVCLLFRE